MVAGAESVVVEEIDSRLTTLGLREREIWIDLYQHQLAVFLVARHVHARDVLNVGGGYYVAIDKFAFHYRAAAGIDAAYDSIVTDIQLHVGLRGRITPSRSHLAACV